MCYKDTGNGWEIDGKNGCWERSGTELRTWRAFTSKTAFDVAKPSAVSHIMTSLDTNGYLVAAFLEEMKDVRGSACIENCET